MNDIFSKAADGIVSTAGMVAASLIVLAASLPKVLNSIKGDSIESTILKRIARHERRMDRMDKTIHRQSVHLTRFEVVVLHLVSLLVANGVAIPKHLQEEVDALTANTVASDMEDDDDEDTPVARPRNKVKES